MMDSLIDKCDSGVFGPHLRQDKNAPDFFDLSSGSALQEEKTKQQKQECAKPPTSARRGLKGR